MDDQKKKCTDCRKDKPLRDFGKSSQYRDGHKYWCKECISRRNKTESSRERHRQYRKTERGRESRRWIELKATYGLSRADYDHLLERQGGGCAVCGSTDPTRGGNSTKYFTVDHCHVTNKIRGLLCGLCNTGLGSFRDNPDVMESAAHYIRTADTGLTARHKASTLVERRKNKITEITNEGSELQSA
jgi:hypothetical protein